MASKDTLPKVKNEHVESQQDEDLATGGDREKTEAKSAKDREKHPHTFYFRECGKEAVNTISCTEAGTVLEALKTSPKFTSLFNKNKGMEIIIVRKTPENADIATHFPCWLIGAEELTIKFRKEKSDPEPPEKATIIEKKKLVTFYVERSGGENCQSKKFLKNMRKISVSHLCIYGYEGETAEEALRRDGRFAEIVFQGGSELMNIKGGDSLEMNLPLTEKQDGKTFKLNMQKEGKKPSQSITETDSRSQIAEQAAGPAQELLREEYEKNIKVIWDVKRVKNLMETSKSVCVLINNTANLQGTGFLLFDRFILTNACLIKDSNDSIDVNFHYEEEPMTKELLLPVKVIDWANEWDEEKCWLDYALLELSVTTADLPPPLLTQYGPPIERGGVCIIGHPGGGRKRVDFCSVIESRQRESVFEKNKNLIQWMNWDLSLVAKDSPTITYDTCFFHGTSGSPVFDADGQVVAMHTGGYSYELGETKNMIAYAIPLQPILKRFLKMAKEQKPDIFRSFIKVAEKQKL